jgi:hypothetical protein
VKVSRRNIVTAWQGIRLVVRDPALLLWSCYVLLFPVYFWSSGLPQPSDLCIVALLPFAMVGWDGRLVTGIARTLRPLALFVGYVVVSNLAWSAILGRWSLSAKEGFLMTPTYYIFDALLFVVVLIMYRRHRARFVSLTLNLVLASVLIQAAVSLVHVGGAGGRGAVLFKNPNQLGFFALLSASILTLGRRRFGLRTLPATVGLIACVQLAVLSASKAALAGTGILAIFGLLSNPRAVILAAVGFAGLLAFADPVIHAVERAQHRIDETSRYGFLTDRGYDRILEYKEYWLLGSGEGDYERFEDTTLIGDHELHSSAGTLFFCYGIVGTGLFLIFIGRIVVGARLRNVVMLVPAGAYGLSHQGMRFTLLWVLLGLFVCVREIDLAPRRDAAKRARRPGGLDVKPAPVAAHGAR